jgi:hypothetical protein
MSSCLRITSVLLAFLLGLSPLLLMAAVAALVR